MELNLPPFLAELLLESLSWLILLSQYSRSFYYVPDILLVLGNISGENTKYFFPNEAYILMNSD